MLQFSICPLACMAVSSWLNAYWQACPTHSCTGLLPLHYSILLGRNCILVEPFCCQIGLMAMKEPCPCRRMLFFVDFQNAVVIALWPGHDIYQGPYTDRFIWVLLATPWCTAWGNASGLLFAWLLVFLSVVSSNALMKVLYFKGLLSKIKTLLLVKDYRILIIGPWHYTALWEVIFGGGDDWFDLV